MKINQKNITMKKILGVKGFDKDLRCRNFQYEIGKTYSIDAMPKLCDLGFHYCQEIKDVYGYYKNSNGNRFCIVEILGDIDLGVGKCCTNKIKILKEIYPGKEQLFCEEELLEYNNIGFVIGGSFALKIYGYNLGRDSKEIDLVVKNDKLEKLLESFDGKKEIRRYSGIDSQVCFVGLFGQKYDILTQTNNIPTSIRNYKGVDLILVEENYIWEKKLEYALKGSLKHMNDIMKCSINFMVKPKRKRVSNDISDLPF